MDTNFDIKYKQIVNSISSELGYIEKVMKIYRDSLIDYDISDDKRAELYTDCFTEVLKGLTADISSSAERLLAQDIDKNNKEDVLQYNYRVSIFNKCLDVLRQYVGVSNKMQDDTYLLYFTEQAHFAMQDHLMSKEEIQKLASPLI